MRGFLLTCPPLPIAGKALLLLLLPEWTAPTRRFKLTARPVPVVNTALAEDEEDEEGAVPKSNSASSSCAPAKGSADAF